MVSLVKVLGSFARLGYCAWKDSSRLVGPARDAVGYCITYIKQAGCTHEIPPYGGTDFFPTGDSNAFLYFFCCCCLLFIFLFGRKKIGGKATIMIERRMERSSYNLYTSKYYLYVVR